METINDIFPPLDPLCPDMDTQSFIGMANGVLESSFPQLSPSSNTMADSMLDDADDLNTLALGEHPFMEITSGIHIKQEYEDDEEEEEDTVPAVSTASMLGGIANSTVHHTDSTAMKPPVSTTDPSMIRGLLQRPTPLPTVIINGKAHINGVGVANQDDATMRTANSLMLQLGRGMYSNSELQSLFNGCQVSFH